MSRSAQPPAGSAAGRSFVPYERVEEAGSAARVTQSSFVMYDNVEEVTMEALNHNKFIDWVEKNLGDADDIFSFSVPKTVVIRDRSLGLLYYLTIGIALAFSFSQLILRREYLTKAQVGAKLKLSAIGGTVHGMMKAGRFDDFDLGLNNPPMSSLKIPTAMFVVKENRSAKCLNDDIGECPWKRVEGIERETDYIEDPLSSTLLVGLASEESHNYTAKILPRGNLSRQYPVVDRKNKQDLMDMNGSFVLGHTLVVQLRDLMEMAGWTFKTCEVSVYIKPPDIRFIQSCHEAKPLRNRPDGASSLSAYRRLARLVGDNCSYCRGFEGFNDTETQLNIDGFSQVSRHASQPSERFNITFACFNKSGFDKVKGCFLPWHLPKQFGDSEKEESVISEKEESVIEITGLYTNECLFKVQSCEGCSALQKFWTRVARTSMCIVKHGLAYYQANMPPYLILSAAMVSKRKRLGLAGQKSVTYQVPDGLQAFSTNRVVSETYGVTVSANLVADVDRLDTSVLIAILSGYGTLFVSCLAFVKFVARYVMRKRRIYSALMEQQSPDFSVLDKLAEDIHSRSFTRALLKDVVKKVEGEQDVASIRDVVTLLVAIDRRLSVLDAHGDDHGDPTEENGEKEGLHEYLMKEFEKFKKKKGSRASTRYDE